MNRHNKIVKAGRSNWSLLELTFLARTWGEIHSRFTTKEAGDVVAGYLEVTESQDKKFREELERVLYSHSVLSKNRTDYDRRLGVVDPFVDGDMEYFFICLELNM